MNAEEAHTVYGWEDVTQTKDDTCKVSARHPKPLRAQASIEYLATYGWALLIAIVALELIYFYLISPNIIAPQSCSFAIGVSCSDIIAVSNSASTSMIGIEITNTQEYPISGAKIFANINGTNSSSVACTHTSLPGNVITPGNMTSCYIILPVATSTGSLLFGSLYINASYCGLLPNFNGTPKGCATANAPIQTYAGTFNVHVT